MFKEYDRLARLAMHNEPCNFRLYKKCGARCNKLEQRCFHGIRGETFQPILSIMLKDDVRWNWDNAFDYFYRAYTCGFVPPFIGAAIEYIFCKYDISTFALKINWIPKRGVSASKYICIHFFRLYQISCRPRTVAALTALQERFRRVMRVNFEALQGPWSSSSCNIVPVNKDDVFTLEPIDDIPVKERFSYAAQDGQVYAFSAKDLNHYISTNQAINPFTREELPPEALERLTKMIMTLPKETKVPITFWRNPTDAFVDILYSYECYGFYTHVEWFTSLSGENIYEIYTKLSLDRHIPPHVFNIEHLERAIGTESSIAEIEECMQYALATTMRNIIVYPFATQFYTICRLFLCLADINNDVRSVIPQWVIAGAGAALD